MTRRRGRSLRVWWRLFRRDLSRSSRQLVRVHCTRGQLQITLTRPRFGRSRYYLRQWRATRRTHRSFAYGIAAGAFLLLIGFGGISYVLVELTTLQPSPPRALAEALPVKKLFKQTPNPPHLSRSLPTHLSIPDAHIDTDLIQLGINADGSLETPDSYTVAGWYTGSPTPGEIGPSVITGHVDNYKGPAVFFYLKTLQPGQKIMVTRADGSVATFAVTHLAQFDQDHFPTQDVYGNTQDAELRLITCGGPFNHISGEYTQNTVVYATYVAPAGS